MESLDDIGPYPALQKNSTLKVDTHCTAVRDFTHQCIMGLDREADCESRSSHSTNKPRRRSRRPRSRTASGSWSSSIILGLCSLCIYVDVQRNIGSDAALGPCTNSMIEAVNTECEGQLSKRRVFFFNSSCDASSPASVKLPAPEVLPCQCETGYGIADDTLKCERCGPGKYGPGGKVLDSSTWGMWNRCPSGLYLKEDSTEMSTFCESGNLSVVTNIYEGSACQPWRPGPPDGKSSPTTGPVVVPSTCRKSDQSYIGSHSYLLSGVQPRNTRVLSVLHTVVEIVRVPASIDFTYFVDATPCFDTTSGHCDGLSFYIDNDETMTTQSQQLTWQKMSFSILEAGFHSLRWQMRISDVDDSKATSASNQAALRSIVLVGVEGNSSCAPCPSGTYSPTSNSSSCTMCPEFHYQDSSGKAECKPCPNDTYSLKGGSQCYPKRRCTENDLIKNLADISTCYHDVVNNKYVRNETISWLHHYGYSQPLCDKTALSPEQTRNRLVRCQCQPGQQFINLKTQRPFCQNCPKAWYSQDGVSCQSCHRGRVTTGELAITSWSTLPDGFTSSCFSCEGQQWLPNGDSLRTGYSTTSYDLQLVWDGITIVREGGGYLEFECSVDCSLDRGAGAHSGRALPLDPAAPGGVSFSSHCHLEFWLDDKAGVHEPIACAPPELRNGTIVRHLIGLPAGEYRFIWFYHQLDVHFAQSIGMEARLHKLRLVGLNSTLGGASSCLTCPAGTRQNDDQTECLTCPPGTFSEKGQDTCTPCPPGKIATGNMSSSCEDCPAGTYSQTHTHCGPCWPGTFAPGGTDQCETCSEGTFADKWGMPRCTQCGKGTTNARNFTTCDNKHCRVAPSFNVTAMLSVNGTHNASAANYTYDFSPLGEAGGGMLLANKNGSDGICFYMNLCTVEHDNSHCVDNNGGQPINSMVCAEQCCSSSSHSSSSTS
eukprot:scpid40160/ scgid0260/ UPF0577 protein KIAA1324-like; Estrogen-induced gene 121-like protein